MYKKLMRKARTAKRMMKTEGFGATAKKVGATLLGRSGGISVTRDISPNATFFDVMFINGCHHSVPHPIRYRIDHQSEQLRAHGLTTCTIEVPDLREEHACMARAFVIFRCAITPEVEKFIALAKQLNKKVFFDIDDLVIDRAYTDELPAVAAMPPDERALYDQGVERMGATLRTCGSAITSTDRLETELSKFVGEVFVNRNTASDEMLYLSARAVAERDKALQGHVDDFQHHADGKRQRKDSRFAEQLAGNVVVGYFSGSSTHNEDFELIAPALAAVLQARPHVKLLVVGELNLPAELAPFAERVLTEPFCPWRNLPGLIALADINLVPLLPSVFNEAKSENKWVEASLVKVPTIASNVGALGQMVEDGKTGLLCDGADEWQAALLSLVDDAALRRQLAEAAFKHCVEHHTTIRTGARLATYLKGRFTPNLFMVLPSLNISGGVTVAIKHCAMLQREGIDVTLVHDSPLEAGQPATSFVEYDGCKLPVVQGRTFDKGANELLLAGSVDQMVATLWTTTWFFDSAVHIGSKLYLVQGYETDFNAAPSPVRLKANATYLRDDCAYLTVSAWCRSWLTRRFGRAVRFAPNGIDLALFPPCERAFNPGERVRVLIEGDSAAELKNVDEAFRVVDHLDPQRFEVWYLSYGEGPKDWYRVDYLQQRVPHERVGQVYAACDILLKTSLFESFSYPPLEMMATGGFVVAIPNEGNAEYLEHGTNCLLFESGDVAGAVAAIQLIADDPAVRKRLAAGGRATAQERSWDKLEPQVLALYE